MSKISPIIGSTKQLTGETRFIMTHYENINSQDTI